MGIDGSGKRRHHPADSAVHTHYDSYALTGAVVAARTGAVIAGGRSAANIAAGRPSRGGGSWWSEPHLAAFRGVRTRLLHSEHARPIDFPGEITELVVPPAKAAAYRCGGVVDTGPPPVKRSAA